MIIDKKYVLTGLVASSIMLHTGMNISFADTSYKVITANDVNFRSGPSTSYSSIGKFKKGDKVEYLGESGSWVKVKYSNKTGYVYGSYVGEDTSSITSAKYVTATSLNVRSGPSTSYSVIGKLSNGSKVEVISTSNGWSKIKYNNQTGYVSSQYLSNTISSSQPSTTTIKYVTATSLNVRSGPSTSYSVIGKLSNGSKVEVISTSNGWSKIKYNNQTGYVSSQYLSDSISDSSNSTSSSVNKVISLAKSLLGKPYVWGAQGPSSFDCSGFTYYVFKNAANITLPRVSKDQSNYGTYVSKSNLKVGDLIFFDTSGSNDGNVSHVGIYLGNNEFIHSSSSKGQVVISQMSTYYNNAYVNARRVL